MILGSLAKGPSEHVISILSSGSIETLIKGKVPADLGVSVSFIQTSQSSKQTIFPSVARIELMYRIEIRLWKLTKLSLQSNLIMLCSMCPVTMHFMASDV